MVQSVLSGARTLFADRRAGGPVQAARCVPGPAEGCPGLADGMARLLRGSAFTGWRHDRRTNSTPDDAAPATRWPVDNVSENGSPPASAPTPGGFCTAMLRRVRGAHPCARLWSPLAETGRLSRGQSCRRFIPPPKDDTTVAAGRASSDPAVGAAPAAARPAAWPSRRRRPTTRPTHLSRAVTP